MTKTILAFLVVAVATIAQSPPPRYARPVHTPPPAAPPTTLHPAPRLTGHEANQAAMAAWQAQIAPQPKVVAPQQPQQTQALPLGAYWYAQQQQKEREANQQPQAISAAESHALPIDCGPIYLTCADDTTTKRDPFPLGTRILDGTNPQQEPKGRLYERPSAVTYGTQRVILLSCPANAVYVSECSKKQ